MGVDVGGGQEIRYINYRKRRKVKEARSGSWELREERETSLYFTILTKAAVWLIITTKRKADFQQKCFMQTKSTELSAPQSPQHSSKSKELLILTLRVYTILSFMQKPST